jgi:predicted dehydrogenase
MRKQQPQVSRRDLLKTAGAVAAFTIVPRHVLGGQGQTPPSGKLNIAAIGAGGIGIEDIEAVTEDSGVKIVALCDADQTQGHETIIPQFPQAKVYSDFRKMFDEMDKQIDAVIVSTPDHTHAVAAMAAIKRGKHVYCQKPLAHSVGDVRALMKAAQEHKVVTQLGNQGHSYETCRLLCEWIWDGAIGKVHTIHAGSSSFNSGIEDLPRLGTKEAVPAGLDWDAWLGPVQERPYHSFYMPRTWRGWTAFGNGTIGDWVCHIFDPVVWALDLGAPETIQAEVKNYNPKTQGEVFPEGAVITFQFPAKGDRGPISIVWHDGTEELPRPKELEEGLRGVDIGAYVYGDKGVIEYGSHGAMGLRIVPDSAMKAYKRPQPKLPRVKEHHADWLAAIREGRKAGSDFSYGGPLTEIAMLGVIALKLPGTKLAWDAPNMRFTNCDEANQYLNPPCRKGWTL